MLGVEPDMFSGLPEILHYLCGCVYSRRIADQKRGMLS